MCSRVLIAELMVACKRPELRIFLPLGSAAALQCMRRKAMFEKQVEQHNNQLLRLEEQLIQLEASKATAEVFQSMKTANEATRANLRNARMEEFDQVLDNVQETQDEISEINEALGRPIGSAQEADDDDLLAELDEMEAKDLDNELLETDSGASRMEFEDTNILPPPVVVEHLDDDSNELEELNAEIGM